MLKRRENESAADYHKRLVFGKLVDKTLADVDYSELSAYVYGREYSSDVARRMMYGSKETLQLLDEEMMNKAAVQGDDIAAELERKTIELQMARQRFFDQRNAFNKLVRERAREEELNDVITKAIKNNALPHLMPVSDKQHCNDDVTADGADLLISLNDLHFGAVVDNFWCKYDSAICAQMMNKYLIKVLNIAATHKAENCIVWANGDLISGNIHHQIAVSNKENLMEQVMGVSELIAQFLAALSEHFICVGFVSVAGNHSRLDIKERALAGERLDDLVEWYLRARMHEYSNVVIGCGKRVHDTMYMMEVRGKNYVGVHGDFDPTPQNAQSLQTMLGTPVYGILTAHLHHNAYDSNQGIRVFRGGSFLGMDEHCVSKRIFGNPEQLVLVADRTGVQCAYNVDLKV